MTEIDWKQRALAAESSLEETRRERDSIYAAIEDWCCKPEAVEGQATAFRDKFYEYKQRAELAESSLSQERADAERYRWLRKMFQDSTFSVFSEGRNDFILYAGGQVIGKGRTITEAIDQARPPE